MKNHINKIPKSIKMTNSRINNNIIIREIPTIIAMIGTPNRKEKIITRKRRININKKKEKGNAVENIKGHMTDVIKMKIMKVQKATSRKSRRTPIIQKIIERVMITRIMKEFLKQKKYKITDLINNIIIATDTQTINLTTIITITIGTLSEIIILTIATTIIVTTEETITITAITTTTILIILTEVETIKIKEQLMKIQTENSILRTNI